jgi:peptide/nickel transport system permease protein
MMNTTCKHTYNSFWRVVWKQFCHRKLGLIALAVVAVFCLAGVYAPFLAASKPLVVKYNEEWFFPLFRYLFYRGYYTKRLDIFFNLLMFTLPLCLLWGYVFRHRAVALWTSLCMVLLVQIGMFTYFAYFPTVNPAMDSQLNRERQEALKSHPMPSWSFDLRYMTPYAKLNLALKYRQMKAQQVHLKPYIAAYMEGEGRKRGYAGIPTLWQQSQDNAGSTLLRRKEQLQTLQKDLVKNQQLIKHVQAEINYTRDREQWLQDQQKLIRYDVMPLIRPFHWEDDAGGEQSLNRYLPFWELTRVNRKDLVAALIFGVRISLVVGILAVSLAMLIGLPIGAFSGFYGGKTDIIVNRLLEIWESMPAFFMLLMIVAIMQSKSIFLIIAVIGIFGWTTFSRYLRGEFLKQRNLPYVEACRAMGFGDARIIASHIFPNAIPPVLTLLPFAIMAAITSEAALSFLGLGEEGSCSWGVLMDEGRSAFPAESYLLWPPAILLTTLLVAIALVGDSFRDALDPKMHK